MVHTYSSGSETFEMVLKIYQQVLKISFMLEFLIMSQTKSSLWRKCAPSLMPCVGIERGICSSEVLDAQFVGSKRKWLWDNFPG
jgi:hypothetical protein